MAKREKKIPVFEAEDQEREFWSESDSSEYFDWSEGQPLVLPRLKPSLKPLQGDQATDGISRDED